jgi:hypothetical protein
VEAGKYWITTSPLVLFSTSLHQLSASWLWICVGGKKLEYRKVVLAETWDAHDRQSKRASNTDHFFMVPPKKVITM